MKSLLKKSEASFIKDLRRKKFAWPVIQKEMDSCNYICGQREKKSELHWKLSPLKAFQWQGKTNKTAKTMLTLWRIGGGRRGWGGFWGRGSTVRTPWRRWGRRFLVQRLCFHLHSFRLRLSYIIKIIQKLVVTIISQYTWSRWEMSHSQPKIETWTCAVRNPFSPGKSDLHTWTPMANDRFYKFAFFEDSTKHSATLNLMWYLVIFQ